MPRRHRVPPEVLKDIEDTIEGCLSLDIDCSSCAIRKECCPWCDKQLEDMYSQTYSDGEVSERETMRLAEWQSLKARIVHVQRTVVANTRIVPVRVVPVGYSGYPGHPIPEGCTARDKYSWKKRT